MSPFLPFFRLHSVQRGVGKQQGQWERASIPGAACRVLGPDALGPRRGGSLATRGGETRPEGAGGSSGARQIPPLGFAVLLKCTQAARGKLLTLQVRRENVIAGECGANGEEGSWSCLAPARRAGRETLSSPQLCVRGPGQKHPRQLPSFHLVRLCRVAGGKSWSCREEGQRLGSRPWQGQPVAATQGAPGRAAVPAAVRSCGSIQLVVCLSEARVTGVLHRHNT